MKAATLPGRNTAWAVATTCRGAHGWAAAYTAIGGPLTPLLTFMVPDRTPAASAPVRPVRPGGGRRNAVAAMAARVVTATMTPSALLLLPDTTGPRSRAGSQSMKRRVVSRTAEFKIALRPTTTRTAAGPGATPAAQAPR